MHKHSQLHRSPQTHAVSTSKNRANNLIVVLFLADPDEIPLEYESLQYLANGT